MIVCSEIRVIVRGYFMSGLTSILIKRNQIKSFFVQRRKVRNWEWIKNQSVIYSYRNGWKLVSEESRGYHRSVTMNAVLREWGQVANAGIFSERNSQVKRNTESISQVKRSSVSCFWYDSRSKSGHQLCLLQCLFPSLVWLRYINLRRNSRASVYICLLL